MKKRILLFTAIAGIGYLSLSSYITGPGTNGYECTGADAATSLGNPTGCTESGCHSASATPGIVVNLELDSAGVPVTNYVGGQVYTVKITGTNTTTSNLPRFGFQVGATNGTTAVAAPVNAGIFQFTGLPANVHYRPARPGLFLVNVVEHTAQLMPASGTGATGTTYTESFNWTAPAAGTGTVSMWAALNAVNNNGLEDVGDLWNTTHILLNEETIPSTAVASVNNNFTFSVYPNPAINSIQLQMNNAKEGMYTVTAYDMVGKRIDMKNVTVSSATSSVTINTASWKAGMYLLQVATDGITKTIQVIKQ